MSDGAREPAGWAGGRGRGWAGGRFRSPVGRREESTIREAAAPAPANSAPVPAARSAGAMAAAAGPRGAADRAGEIAAEWAPTAGRILLGLVLAWFGYHELVLPGEWTGYVPVINETSDLAIIAVLVHGWRDVGVLGLAICLTGCHTHRLALRG